ncbi:O-acetylserine/cysteine efflux transporter [Dongia mobilis]|uniref:O-acetylserine/cysteine efflux transporter n=1 Tax=Dongia mobilis TaxID=578943 RepID=A0A4R6WUW3_9PROT|nr:EamA family transporter [Dongia mobilis]TDQ83950.1 O-acetylserine/cysteine efflux transporter [Dongia mobilis]
MKPQHFALMLLVQLIWGVNFVAAKIGLAHFESLFFLALRFSLVALLLLPFVGLPRRKLKQLIPLSMTMGAMHFGLIFLGMRYLDAATSSIAVQLQVPFAAILAAFFFGETLGWRRILGMIVAFAGVVLIAGEPRFADGNLWPLVAVIGAALVWATGNVQVKALGEEFDAVQLNGYIAILAAPQLLALSLLIEGNQFPHVFDIAWAGWAALLFQSIIVAIFSYIIWYNLMRRYPVNQVMPFTLLLPMIGVISGHLILNEVVTWQMVLGGIATMAGVAIVVIRRPAVVAPSTKTGI